MNRKLAAVILKVLGEYVWNWANPTPVAADGAD
jgi:hypothetical protein